MELELHKIRKGRYRALTSVAAWSPLPPGTVVSRARHFHSAQASPGSSPSRERVFSVGRYSITHPVDECRGLPAPVKTDNLTGMRQLARGPVFVLHYHEIWLKGKNRHFFRSRLKDNVRRALEDLGVDEIRSVAHRILVTLQEGADAALAAQRIGRILGLAYFAPVLQTADDLQEIRRAAWKLLAGKKFSSFAVRVKVGGAGFLMSSVELERDLGTVILEQARREGRSEVRVHLSKPEITCRVEVIPGSALLYATRVEGPGGLPAASGGHLLCLVSGGFDSAVAAYKMMRRGVHVSFIHFYGVSAQPGESSLPVVREIVERLTPFQFTSRLFLIPFDPIQREIVAQAPQQFRILLYRRMMLRIAQEVAREEGALGLITGDSVCQVASQTLHNMAAVDSVARCPIYRPLSGDDKLEILRIARQIGTYEVSCEPFQDCCPRYMPRSPALHATADELDRGEAGLDVFRLTRLGLASAQGLSIKYEKGNVTHKSFRVRALGRPPKRAEAECHGVGNVRDPRLGVPSSAEAV